MKRTKKRILAFLLSVLLLASVMPMEALADDIAADPAETTPATEPTASTEAEGSPDATDATDVTEATEQTVSNEETLPEETVPEDNTPGIAERLLTAETLSALWDLFMAEENHDAVLSLTQEEIQSLLQHLDQLYQALTEPTDEDTALYEELTETLKYLPAMECPECGEFGSHADDCVRNTAVLPANDFAAAVAAQPISGDSIAMKGEYVLSGNVSLPRIVSVLSGQTLKITGTGTITKGDWLKEMGWQMFYVAPGGRLIIGDATDTGSAKDTIIIDGENNICRRPMFLSQGGSIELYHVTLRNNKNRGINATGATASSFPGGAIYNAAYTQNNTLYVGTTTIRDCSINHNTTYSRGGGIYSECSMTITNSEIVYNNAIARGTLQETGAFAGKYLTPASGAGGGFYIGGTASVPNPSCTITNCNISNNTAVSYGGGGEVSNGATLTLESGSINYNRSMNRGAGGLHVTGKSAFIMKGGELTGNVAHEVGGAIHTSYSCTLKLDGGQIKDNVVYGRGGGIHIDCGGDLKLNGTNIISNHAYDSITLHGVTYHNIGMSNIVGGVYTDAKGDEISEPIWTGTAQYRGDAGYGGGILIDCGTFTLNSGVISGNTASVGGGGVCFVMILISHDSRFGETGVSGLQMNGGSITGNHANKWGGGVYLMKNVLTPENVASVGNWTFVWDSEGGITFYNSSNTPIVMKRADGTALTAKEVGAIFTAIPEIHIDGGIVSYNTAGTAGGAIYQEENTRFFISNSAQVLENTAVDGGAIFIAGGTAAINGGEIFDNTASSNGGALYVSGTVTMSAGEITSNEATDNGGAVYVTGGTFTMTGGDMRTNHAANGGAAYIDGGAITITNGTMIGNHAVNGGAAYVSGGNFTFNSGTMRGNTADNNGGAAYIAGTDTVKGVLSFHDGTFDGNQAANFGGAVYIDHGQFDMYGGAAMANTAEKGGVAYITGGDCNMISGTMIGNGTQEDADGNVTTTTQYGGAVYVDGGTIKVGVEGCVGGDEGTYHTVSHTDKTHPIIQGNSAEFGGAFAVRGQNDANGNVITGEAFFFCGHITGNSANNEGTGHNIFMDGGGVVHHEDSAVVGDDDNHGIVSVGGSLTIHGQETIVTITLVYDSMISEDGVSSITIKWVGTAPEGYTINLPYCPQEWVTQQNQKNLTFVGWSAEPMVAGSAGYVDSVREKGDYFPVGTPQLIDGGTENQMIFYAVWAPLTNNIAYAYALLGGSAITGSEAIQPYRDGDFTCANQPAAYAYTGKVENLNVSDPVRPGYTFIGWLVYADTQKVSDWGADPADNMSSSDVTLLSHIDRTNTVNKDFWNGYSNRNFGDITLVAVFRPNYTNLTITTSSDSLDANQTFVFTINGTPYDTNAEFKPMTVVIVGNDSITIEKLPVGDYTVTEVTQWSWRYSIENIQSVTPAVVNGNSAQLQLENPDLNYTVQFEKARVIPYWLSGCWYWLNKEG